MTKVTGNVRLRLVKPFNVKQIKYMFAEVFPPLVVTPVSTYTLGIQNGNCSYKECECMPVILGNSVPFI